MIKNKNEWIVLFRNYGNQILNSISISELSKNDKAKKINKQITDFKDLKISELLKFASREKLTNEELLNEILILTYSYYIAMLEFRNKVWKYEYMAFARRIGELWEPFCKLTFQYSLKPLTIVKPPKFEKIQKQLKQEAVDYINNINLPYDIKKELINYYSIPWNMVDSGGIKLELDLHFIQNNIRYNCDFKSGFSSNEKGNTNRLLLVASIYNSLGTVEKTILFVRQNEDDNNHYLQTLKNSNYWEVFCANNAYDTMMNFTGFNLRKWLDDNVDWINDISVEFRNHLQKNDLLKYLTW